MECGEGAAVAVPGHDEPKCPFCSEPGNKNYHTKDGAKRNATVLAENLRADGKTDIQRDSGAKNVGTIYPLPGGNDPTIGWMCEKRLFLDKNGDRINDEVFILAVAHHLIPGEGAMAKSDLETWTCESPPKPKAGPAKITQDIGYSIDGAPNGIFLPGIPEPYKEKNVPSTKMKMTAFYNTELWGDLNDADKEKFSYRIMIETQLQFHQTSHGARYLSDTESNTDSNPNLSYDEEAINYCNQLAGLMKAKSEVCTNMTSDGKFNPPYPLVRMINGKSWMLRRRITRDPGGWKSWVTRLAQKLTIDVKNKTEKAIVLGKIHRKPEPHRKPEAT